MTVPIHGRGKGTAEPNVGTLKVNVRGCDWGMQLFTKGLTHASVIHIPKGAVSSLNKYLHIKIQILDMNNI